MTDYVTVPIKVPVISLEVSGEFSRYKKPSGLENLILTAIGTPKLNNETWRSFFKRLEIPESMTPLFRSVFDDLYDNDVIDSYEFDLDNRIKNTGFTETGRDLFEQGRVKQEPTTFSENIYYMPYSNYFDDAYTFSPSTSSSNGFDEDRFSGLEHDADRLKEFVDTNKKKLGADHDDIVLQINIDDKEILCADKNVKLSFDEASGDFSFESDVDPNFLKGYYSVDDLIPENSEIHEIPKNITVKKIGNVPKGWDSYKYMMPRNFMFKGLLKAFDGNSVSIDGAFLIEDLGYQFVDIMSSATGRGYIFVKKTASIFGFQGETEYTALISRPLSKEEIKNIIQKIINTNKDANLQQFIQILTVLDLSEDTDYVCGVIRDYLSKCKDINESILLLKKVKGKWTQKLGVIIEGALCDRSKDVDDIVSILKYNNLTVSGETIADHYSSDNIEKNILLADKLFPVVSGKSILSAQLGIKDALTTCVLEQKKIPGCKSVEMMAVDALSDSFSIIIKTFNIKGVNDYDLTKVDETTLADIGMVYETASKAMKTCGMIMAGSTRYQEVDDYMDMFENLVEIYGTEVPLERLTGFYFGVGLRRKIETMLRSLFGDKLELSKMIDLAHDKKYITADQRELLHKMRDYGNKCAHPTDVVALENKEKQKWVSELEKINKELKKKGQK